MLTTLGFISPFQSIKYLWSYCPVVDANVIYQAGEVCSGSHSATSADVHAGTSDFHAILYVLSRGDTIYVERPLRTIPNKSYAVPLVIRNSYLGEQWT